MSPESEAALAGQIKALTFDVFGTTVDWRTSVVAELTAAAERKMGSPEFAALPAEVQARARALTAASEEEKGWGGFAQAWRDSYGRFTRSFVPGETAWKDVDAHYRDSLAELLAARGLAGLYDEAEIRELSLAWHRLRPWPDAAPGLALLNGRYVTSTLSNGNSALLADLDAYGPLGFRRLLSAEDFRTYKPNPAVYLGAARALGAEPGEVAMVAAHLGDLAAARALGMRTVYVERPREEAWGADEERTREARGWVDMYVGLDGEGFVEVARRLGLS